MFKTGLKSKIAKLFIALSTLALFTTAIASAATYSGEHLIEFKSTGMGVNAQYAPKSGQANIVLDGLSNRESNEIWNLQYNSKYDAYYITPRYRSGAALNALFGRDARLYSQVKLHDSNINDTASLWKIERSGSYVRLKNVACNYYLEANGGKTKAGTALILAKNSGSSNQQFKLTSVNANVSNNNNNSNNKSNSTVAPANNSASSAVWPVGGNGGTDLNNWPRYSSGKYHSGTDISAPKGTPVYATYSGVVDTVKSLTSSYGKHVIIKSIVDGKTVYIYYCHLDSYSVSKGQAVTAGQQIGKVGSTGNSSGNHLHYEVRNANKSYGSLKNPTLNPHDFLPRRTISVSGLKNVSNVNVSSIGTSMGSMLNPIG